MNKKDKKTSSTRKPYTFKRVSENLYKVIETGGYYALVKRGGKQIRRSLKTTDKALARRRLAELEGERPPNSALARRMPPSPSRVTLNVG